MGFRLQDHTIGSILETVQPYYKKNYGDAVNMSSNEMIHPGMGQLFQDFCQEYNPQLVGKYPYYPRVEAELAEHLGISPDELLLTASSDDAIKLVITSVCKATKHIILPTPNYENYFIYADLNQVEKTELECYFDLKKFVGELKQKIQTCPPSVVQITNPNGWTGYCLEIPEMREIAKLCQANNHILLIDEAYISFNGFDHLELISEFDNVILIRSFSKSFGIAGLRVATILAHPKLIDYIVRWRPSNPLSSVTIEFLSYCLREIQKVDQIRQEVIDNREKLKKSLKILFEDWTIYDSLTNFILIDIGSKAEQQNLVEFLRSENIIVKNTSSIPHLETCIRVTVGDTKTSNLLVTKLKEWKGE